MDDSGFRKLLAEFARLIPSPFKSEQEKKMDILKKMKSDVAEHGFSVMTVFPSGESRGFVYTIGLTESANHPELLIFGLPPQMAHIVMHDLVAQIKQGVVYHDSDLIVDVLSLPVAAKSITTARAAEYTVQLFNYYAHRPTPPAVLQLVVPDTCGRFPWAENFEERLRNMQPALWEALH